MSNLTAFEIQEILDGDKSEYHRLMGTDVIINPGNYNIPQDFIVHQILRLISENNYTDIYPFPLYSNGLLNSLKRMKESVQDKGYNYDEAIQYFTKPLQFDASRLIIEGQFFGLKLFTERNLIENVLKNSNQSLILFDDLDKISDDELEQLIITMSDDKVDLRIEVQKSQFGFVEKLLDPVKVLLSRGTAVGQTFRGHNLSGIFSYLEKAISANITKDILIGYLDGYAANETDEEFKHEYVRAYGLKGNIIDEELYDKLVKATSYSNLDSLISPFVSKDVFKTLNINKTAAKFNTNFSVEEMAELAGNEKEERYASSKITAKFMTDEFIYDHPNMFHPKLLRESEPYLYISQKTWRKLNETFGTNERMKRKEMTFNNIIRNWAFRARFRHVPHVPLEPADIIYLADKFKPTKADLLYSLAIYGTNVYEEHPENDVATIGEVISHLGEYL